MRKYDKHKARLEKSHSHWINFIEFNNVKPAKAYNNIFYNKYIVISTFLLSLLISYITIGAWFGPVHKYWLALIPTLSLMLLNNNSLDRIEWVKHCYIYVNLVIVVASYLILPDNGFVNMFNFVGAGSILVWTMILHSNEETLFHDVVDDYVTKHPPVKLVYVGLAGTFVAAALALLFKQVDLAFALALSLILYFMLSVAINSLNMDSFYLERYLYTKHLEKRILNVGYIDMQIISLPGVDLEHYYLEDYLMFTTSSNTRPLPSQSLGGLLPMFELFNISYIVYKSGPRVRICLFKEENEPTNPTKYVLKRGKVYSLISEDVA